MTNILSQLGDGFATPLDVRRLDHDRWEVLSPFVYFLETPFEYIEVHKGFVTDFASVPFPFSRIFPPVGKSYDRASVIHDFLYWLPYVWDLNGTCREIDQEEADRIYLDAMRTSKTPLLVRRSIYMGVRLGGSKAWNKYRKEDI